MNLEISDRTPFAIVMPKEARSALGGGKSIMRVRFYAALLVFDCVAIAAAFMTATVLRYGDPFAEGGFNVLIVLLPLYVVIAMNRRVYCSEMFIRWRTIARRALMSLFASMAAVLFIAFFLRAGTDLSREVVTLGTVVSAILLVVSRLAAHRQAKRIFGGEPLALIIIRDDVEIDCPEHFVALNTASLGLRPSLTEPHELDRIGRLLNRADRVVVACPEERRAAWALVFKGANVRGEIVTPELAALGLIGADEVSGAPTLLVSVGPLNLRDRLLKRMLDLSLATAVLIVLAPLMLLTALAVRIDSAGPVFFVQPRLGRGNRLFAMYKFRSMHAAQCDAAGDRSTTRGDARITRIGKLIRATSIDELPQILNVIKGDMSIVGPRPHALGSLAGDKLFWEVDQRYWHRHAAKPGITGLAQVRGFRGATHLSSDLVNRLQADLDYVNGWSIWRDIGILIATFRVVLHRNAY